MNTYQRKRPLSWWLLRLCLPLVVSMFLYVVNLLPFSNFFRARAFAANPVFMESGTDATQGTQFWTQYAGCVSSTTVSHTGPRSFACNQGGWNGINGVLSDTGRRITFYLYISSFPSSDEDIMSVCLADNGTTAFSINIQASSHKLINLITGHLSTTVLQTGVWYRIAVSYTISSTTVNQVNVFIDGNPEISETNFTLNTTGATELELGRLSGLGGAGILFYFDDIYIDDGNTLDDPGDIRVTAKLPNADNTHQFTTNIGNNPGADSRYTNVNERPLSTSNGWQTGSANQSENYGIQNASTGDVDISTATLIANSAWVYANSGSSCTGNITNNGNNASISLTTTNTLFTNNVSSASYPNNSATVGMQSCSSATAVNLYEAGMLVAYIPTGGGGAPEGAFLLLPLLPFIPKLARSLLTLRKSKKHV